MPYTFNTELKTVATKYAQSIGAKITKTSLHKSLEENPSYPSLLALGNVFDGYNISNDAYKIKKEDFDEIASELPFIAFVKLPNVGTDFVLVTAITDKNIQFQHKKSESISKVDFLEAYQGIVWKAELSSESGEPQYEQKLQKEKTQILKKNLAYLTGFVALLLLVAINIPSLHSFSFVSIITLKLIGTFVSNLLLLFEIDKSNSFVKNLCTIGGKANCDAVLSSKASKIAGISWGDIGFYYFASTSIGLLLPNLPFETKSTCIAIGSCLAAPYILFSIYYQWKVIQQWCTLCLIVQAILLFELLWSINTGWQIPLFDLNLIASLLFSLLISIVLWQILKPIFVKAKDHDLYQSAYKRLQYNPEIFKTLLSQQETIPDGWQNLGIDIGNPEATNVLIKICNPYCGPCEKSHAELGNIIKKSENTRLKILYISYNNEYDKGAIVVKHLLAIASEGDSIKTKNALDDWYLDVGKNYDTFASKYPLNVNSDNEGIKLEAMSLWCDAANITHTPTVFLNGFRLPENYTIDDLKYIL